MSVATRLSVHFKGVDKTAGTTKKMESRFKGMATRVAASFAGMFATRMLFSKVKETIQEVHKISDEARQLGVSASFAQKLGNAFGQVGLSAEIANKSIDFMRRNLATKSDMANNIFEQMGLSAQKLKSMGTEEMFVEIGREIAKLPNEIDKVKAAYEIFGRSGAKLVPLFRQGPEAFEESLQDVMNMMPVVKDSVVRNLSDLDDTFAAMKQTIFVDFASALGGAAAVGEESFGRVDVAVFKSFLKVREFAKNFVATLAWIKDSAAATFTDDTFAEAFDRVLDRFQDNAKESQNLLENFEKGVIAKDKLAGLFEGANNGAAELKKNITAIKQSLGSLTLSGSYAAIQAQFKKIGPGQLLGDAGVRAAPLSGGRAELASMNKALDRLIAIAMKNEKNTATLKEIEAI